jgi:hypothetical protein
MEIVAEPDIHAAMQQVIDVLTACAGRVDAGVEARRTMRDASQRSRGIAIAGT